MVNAPCSPPRPPHPLNQTRPARSVHPGLHGMLALAELLLAPLQRALEEEAAGHQLARRDDPRLDLMPPPMIPNSPAERGASFCAIQASCSLPACLRAEGHVQGAGPSGPQPGCRHMHAADCRHDNCCWWRCWWHCSLDRRTSSVHW